MKKENFYVVCNLMIALCLIILVASVLYLINLELTLPEMLLPQIIVVIIAVSSAIAGIVFLIASMGEYKPDKDEIVRPYPIFTGDYDWAVSLREDCNKHWQIHYFYTKSVASAFALYYLQNKKWQNVILEYKKYVYDIHGNSLGWQPIQYPIEEYASIICNLESVPNSDNYYDEALKILRS